MDRCRGGSSCGADLGAEGSGDGVAGGGAGVASNYPLRGAKGNVWVSSGAFFLFAQL